MKSAALNSVANTVPVHGVNGAGQYTDAATDPAGANVSSPQMQRGDPSALRATTANVRAITDLLVGPTGTTQSGGATFKPHQMGTLPALPVDTIAGKAEALQQVYRRALAADSISPSLRREFATAIAALLRVAQPHAMDSAAIGAVVADAVAEKILGDLGDYREAVAVQVAAEAGLVG